MNQTAVNFNQQESLVSAAQESTKFEIPELCKRKTLKAVKCVAKYPITFKLVNDSENQFRYILTIDKINGVPVIEKTKERNKKQLPLTEEWMVEVRERTNGARYKIYYHRRSATRFNSLIKVSEFVEKYYYPKGPVKLQIRAQKERIPLLHLNRMNIIPANNSLNDESSATSVNEEMQSKEEEGMTEEEVQVAKILAHDIGNYVVLN